ncbi:MAG: carboxypeptidase-like regulatory domain-containing protein [Saonia sp.]
MDSLRNFILCTVLSLLAVTIYAQKEYKGQVLDKHTGEPIPYVNIGILNRAKGTVTDVNGYFHLEINPLDYSLEDTLQFSSLGYKTVKKKVPTLTFAYNEYPKIFLEPDIIALDEVVLVAGVEEEQFVNEKIGYKNKWEKIYGYWKDNVSLGGELATKIRVRKGLRKLKSLSFGVWQNESDSVQVRVNIYDDDGPTGFPGTNLNKSSQHILYVIKKGGSLANIDLTPYNVYVKDDFIVSLELLKVYGNSKIALVLAAVKNRYANTYKKSASHDKWQQMKGSAMTYYLESSLLVPDKKTKKK